MKHRAWIALSGIVWFAIGIGLLFKGLRLISEAAFLTKGANCKFINAFGNPEQSAMTLIGIGLLVGFIKGRFVLIKTVRRVVKRISSLPLPIRFSEVYSKSYWILIASMVGLGMSMKFLPIPVDVRGTIDVAIGSALIHGAMLYFRASAQYGLFASK